LKRTNAKPPIKPLRGFTPLQSETLSNVAARLNAKPMSVALAWLLHVAAARLQLASRGNYKISPEISISMRAICVDE
jgi:hypothetical protein